MIPLMMQKGFKPKGWLGLILGTRMWCEFTSIRWLLVIPRPVLTACVRFQMRFTTRIRMMMLPLIVVWTSSCVRSGTGAS
jgi:hypothetical protein